jgi:AmpD protein
MRIDLETGLAPSARQVPSPHHDARPAWATIDLVVIHGISLPPGEFGGPWIDQLFQNRLDPAGHPFFAGLVGLTVSAHFLIRRDGELVQYVPLHRRAWHAGISSFEGRADCNSWALGIELEGTDLVPYEDAQYGTLIALLAALRTAYPAITPERIVGHAEIAPGRKTDPGEAFDWRRIGVAQLVAHLSEDRPPRRPAATR